MPQDFSYPFSDLNPPSQGKIKKYGKIKMFKVKSNCIKDGSPIDLIMSFGTLHFVKKDLWKQFIRRAKDEEIKELYEDWEILQFKSYVFEDEHPNVPKHLHASNKIVARRVK